MALKEKITSIEIPVVVQEKVKEYRCDVCGKAVTEQHRWRKLVIRDDRIDLTRNAKTTVPRDARIYTCDLCGRHFCCVNKALHVENDKIVMGACGLFLQHFEPWYCKGQDGYDYGCYYHCSRCEKLHLEESRILGRSSWRDIDQKVIHMALLRKYPQFISKKKRDHD